MRVPKGHLSAILLGGLLLMQGRQISAAPQHTTPRRWFTGSYLTDPLLTEVEQRAFRFFWEQADPNTGLVKDRASNIGPTDTYTVASIASTGYALAALPIAVQHHWITPQQGYQRALATLRFVVYRMPNVHGWYYHFVDMHTGKRVWNCELSSIDTALLLLGALSAGAQWPGTEVQHLVNTLYARLDWQWMLTNGGQEPQKPVLSMGWKPESGFLNANWDSYSEGIMLYLLGIGAPKNALPVACWWAWKRPRYTYHGLTSFVGGPIFLHEMPYEFFDFRGWRDRDGWDYWRNAANGVKINRLFCLDHRAKRKTYAAGMWGLNASDGPEGYNAYGVPKPEDGTVSPTGAIAAVLFEPDQACAIAHAMYSQFHERLWGRYGFSNAFNLDRNWFDKDVIGIDLGMALLGIEDARTGFEWRRIAALPSTKRAWQRIGFSRNDVTKGR